MCFRQNSDKFELQATANLKGLEAATITFSLILGKVDIGHTKAGDQMKNCSKPATFKREPWGHNSLGAWVLYNTIIISQNST